jgi:zinc-binding in reverse transcriptase
VAGGNCNYDISTHISDSQDTLSWKLTGHRTYTAYSFYNLIADTGKTRSVFPQLWKTKAPLSVKLFFYTLINDKLLTKQVMIKKKIQHGAPNCIIYVQASIFLMSLRYLSFGWQFKTYSNCQQSLYSYPSLKFCRNALT